MEKPSETDKSKTFNTSACHEATRHANPKLDGSSLRRGQSASSCQEVEQVFEALVQVVVGLTCIIVVQANGATVPVAFSEARFQVKKSACFWRHGRYQE